MFKTIRLIIYLALVLIFIIMGILVYRAYFGSRSGGLKIDNTAIMVEEIKKISQLFTTTYYDELVLDTFKLISKTPGERLLDAMTIMRPGVSASNGMNYMNYRRQEMVVIARGRVYSGFDFSRLQESDLHIDDRSITFQLPPAEVLDVIINPSDYEIFIEEGRWSLEEAVSLKQSAANLMEKRAIEMGILEQSETTAIGLLYNFFKALGFEQITIISRLEDTHEPEIFVPAPGIE